MEDKVSSTGQDAKYKGAGPKHILVVDDEPLVLRAVRMMLSYEGHIVEGANNASEALAAFKPGKFDLVITDYLMPGMKGDALAVAIKEQSPNQPVILLTAHAQIIQETIGELKCFDYVVSKPFRLEFLRKVVTQVAR